MVTAEGLVSPASEVVKIVDGQEVVVPGDEASDIQNKARDMLKGAETGNDFLDTVSKSEFSGVKVLTAPVRPVREDFPKTRAGMKAYMTAIKNYNIQYKEFKQSQKDLIKPSESNKNGLTALNKTDGLTSMNGSGSTTIVYQRQVVQVPVATPIKV